MHDMTAAIQPRSDQQNSDDFITGPRTITITRVEVKAAPEQPVSVFFDGDDGKPWKPCKSTSRLLVAGWGPDSSQYVGKSVTLYRDPKVTWGGMEVGGIRISHMSHLERPLQMALTASKKSRAMVTVQPLKAAPPRATPLDAPPANLAPPIDPAVLATWAAEFEAIIESATDFARVDAVFRARCSAPQWADLKDADPARYKKVLGALNTKAKFLKDAAETA